MPPLNHPANHLTRFDNLGVLRLLLATLVAYSHAYPLTGTAEPIAQLLQTHTGGSIAVQGFFLISGYLVTQSLRTSRSLTTYLLSRFLRIWPALACALALTTFCAWLSSPVANSEFLSGSIQYLAKNLTLLNGVSHQLPGAFIDNPMTSVNGSLWTLPWETRLYLMLALVWCLGLMTSPRRFNLTLMALTLLSIAVIEINDLWPLLVFEEVPWLLALFALGAFAQMNSNRMSAGWLATALGLIALASAAFTPKLAVVLLIAALTLTIGFTSLLRLPRLQTDLSYGIYVYAFPIQQLLIHLFPPITPFLLFLVTMILLLPISWISWKLVEKPALALRKPLLNGLHRIWKWPPSQSEASHRVERATAWILLCACGAALLAYAHTLPQKLGAPAVTWGVFYPDSSQLLMRRQWSTGFADFEVVLKPGQLPLLGHWWNSELALGTFDPQQCEFRLFRYLASSRDNASIRVNCGQTQQVQPIAGDWNGDGTTDLGLFFHERAEFQLLLLTDGQPQPFAQFRLGDAAQALIAVAGDWNGDGKTTVGVWDEARRELLLTNRQGDDEPLAMKIASAMPDTAPFAVRLGDTTQIGLHSWRNGTLKLLDSDDIVLYGEPGRRGLPVF